MTDPIEWAKSVADLVKKYVSRSLSHIESRLEALEAKPVRGEKGEPGRDGRDGESVSLDTVLTEIASHVEQAVKSVPVPKDGKDGRDGIDGKSITVEDVRGEVEDFLKLLPVPKDGANGIDGKDGTNGKDGADGKSVTIEEVRGYLDAEVATWALSFERRAQDILQRAIERIEKPRDGRDGRDGLNGKDGSDGVSFDEFHVEQVDDRTLRHVYTRDGIAVKSLDFHMRMPIYREIFKQGEAYQQDDMVTFGGSLWYALRNTYNKPGTDDSWRLCVKAGRDAK